MKLMSSPNAQSTGLTSPARVEGPSLPNSLANDAIDERSLEEMIQRCCSKFSLVILEDMKVFLRNRKPEVLMHQQENERSRAGGPSSSGQSPPSVPPPWHHPLMGGFDRDADEIDLHEHEQERARLRTGNRSSRGHSCPPLPPPPDHTPTHPPTQPPGILTFDAAELHWKEHRGENEGLFTGDRAKPGQPQGDVDRTPDVIISKDSHINDHGDADGGNKEDLEGEDADELRAQSRDSLRSDVKIRFSSADSLSNVKTRASSSGELSEFGQNRQSREVKEVLRAARQTILQRQAQASTVNVHSVALCCGSIVCSDSRLRAILKEDTLDFIMGVLVLVNMAQLGFSADVERDWEGWVVVDCLFACAFLIEFILRILLRGMYNHFIVHWKGTLFDALIVVASLVELVFDLFIGGSLATGAQNLTILRVVRLLRLVRIVKSLRMPMFKDLLKMCAGLLEGSQTLFWSMILLMIPIYCSALLLRETVGTFKTNTDIVKPFTSLPWSFFTTFRCTMGDCAGESGQPLPELLIQKFKFGWIFGVFYVVWILITFLGVFNVIIAIYVEQIVASAKCNEYLQKRRRLGDVKKMDLLLANLIEVFVKAKMNYADDTQLRASQLGDQRRSSVGTVKNLQALDAGEIAAIEITKAFFDKTIDTEDVQNILEQLAIPSEDRWDLFDILDADGSGTLQLGEIIEGLKKLRGDPRRSDVVANGLITRALQKRVHMETESIYLVAKRTAAEVDCIRQEHKQYADTILHNIGALARFTVGGAKMPDASCSTNMVAREESRRRLVQ